MSFGGGVQSTALALLAAQRDPRLLEVTGGHIPDLYLWADTGDERRATYEHIWRLIPSLSVPLIALYQGRLSDHVISKARAGSGGISLPPLWIEDSTGRAMPARRGCTSAFKVKPLDRYAKTWAAGERVVQWYGMSADEPHRLRTSQDKWRTYLYPLWEMRWRRSDCERYLRDQVYADGLPVAIARSSCVFCPFHSREEWRSVASVAEDWGAALAFDDAIRTDGPIAGLRTSGYLHQGRTPLCDLDLSPSAQLDLFGVEREECHGVCGV